MPVDQDGNRADIVMSSDSTYARTNLGRLFEQYFNSAARDVAKHVRKMTSCHDKVSLEQVQVLPKEVIQSALKYLFGYYHIISKSHQYEFFANKISYQQQVEHLHDVICNGIYNIIPIETDTSTYEKQKLVQQFYPPTYGPVTYVGESGKRVTTKDNVRIGPMYIMLLDKIADDWSSVSTGRLQHYGVLSPTTKSEKFSTPFRNSAVRTIGETEGRILVGVAGREAIAEMMDRSNNPRTQRNMVWNILTSDQPSNIEQVVDREHIPYGSTRPLQLINHIFTCAGFIPKYVPEGTVTPELQKLENQS